MNKTIHTNERLRQARFKQGLTQRHLAEMIGVDEQTVRSWERGIRFPSLEFQPRLCQILDSSLEELGLAIRQDAPTLLESLELSVQAEERTDQQQPAPTQSLTQSSTQPQIQAPIAVTQPQTQPLIQPLVQPQTQQLTQSIDGTHPPLIKRSYRRDANRQRMLQRMHSRWITGVLEHPSTSPTSFLLTLSVQQMPDAVKNPWKSARKEAYHTRPTSFTTTHIMDVYTDADGELLLLGDPGAGKTTLLLTLLRTLLSRAEQDDTLPLPVVFQLASWAERRYHLADWLIEELHTKYQIPHKLASAWIMNDQVIPLLDGLDEVKENDRTACIQAINTYRQDHGLLSMVVCSRTADYMAQSERLILGNAVVIQPLTPQQIDMYLARAGHEHTAIRYALQHDPLLQEMATNPLMLTILVHSYHESQQKTITGTTSFEMLRHRILEYYVDHLLQSHNHDPRATHATRHTRRKRHRHAPASPQQTKHWLHWLSVQLIQHNQTEFYLERMQPDWLANMQQRQQYRNTAIRLVYSLEIMVIAALFSLIRGGRIGKISGVGFGLLGWLGAGPGNSVLEWMAPGLGGGLEGGGSFGIIIAMVMFLTILLINRTAPQPSWRHLWYSLCVGLCKGLRAGTVIGLLAIGIFALHNNWRDGIFQGLVTGFFSGLNMSIMAGLITTLQDKPTETENRAENKAGNSRTHKAGNRAGQTAGNSSSTNSQHSFSWNALKTTSINTSIFALCAMGSFSSVYALLIGTINANVLTYGSIAGLFAGIIFGLGGGKKLIDNIGVTIQPAETVAWSWNDIVLHFRADMRQAFMFSSMIAVSMMIIIGGISGFFYGPAYGMRYGLIYGAIIGLISGVAGHLSSILNNGWTSKTLDEHEIVHPNEGIRLSARHALIAACVFGSLGGGVSGIVSGAAFGWIGQLHGWFILGIGFALICGSIFALQAGLFHGGIACLEHYLLRFALWQAGCIPWRYSSFLDDASERFLLRKLGGGYIFAHRLLLEYFATLEAPFPPVSASSPSSLVSPLFQQDQTDTKSTENRHQ
jgi:Predicted NTPase (NACHT family)